MRVSVKNIPGLRRETGDDTVLGVLEANVVVGTANALLLARVELLLQLRVSILDELEPSGDVGVGALSDEANGDLVGAESSPDLLVSLAQVVASKVGSESEVLVEISGQGTESLEVGCGEHWSRALSVEAHDGGVGGGEVCRVECSLWQSCAEAWSRSYASVGLVFDLVFVYARTEWEASGRSRSRCPNLSPRFWRGQRFWRGDSDDSGCW